MTISPGHFAVLGTVVFAIGVFGVMSRRNPLAMLCAVAVMFTGPVIALVGFANQGGIGEPAYGTAIAVGAIVVAVAELAVGAALAIVLWRREQASDVVELDQVSG